MFFDIFGALTSLLSTFLFIRISNKAWLVGMLATAVNGCLYWQKGIYADTALEAIYFVSMCYGWIIWHKHSKNAFKPDFQPIKHLTLFQWSLTLLFVSFLFLVIFYLLSIYTHSTVAVLDSGTTSISLVAQWFMCHKISATWILWFITDTLYSYMYFQKNLPFHSILMLTYTGMAVSGYIIWHKKSKGIVGDLDYTHV